MNKTNPSSAEPKSDCCGGLYMVSTQGEGTSYYVCTECGKPCNLKAEQKPDRVPEYRTEQCPACGKHSVHRCEQCHEWIPYTYTYPSEQKPDSVSELEENSDTMQKLLKRVKTRHNWLIKWLNFSWYIEETEGYRSKSTARERKESCSQIKSDMDELDKYLTQSEACNEVQEQKIKKLEEDLMIAKKALKTHGGVISGYVLGGGTKCPLMKCEMCDALSLLSPSSND